MNFSWALITGVSVILAFGFLLAGIVELIELEHAERAVRRELRFRAGRSRTLICVGILFFVIALASVLFVDRSHW
jgi:uncharacterized membrane protein